MEEATSIGPERRRWKRFLIPAAWILAAHILVVAFLCASFDVRCVGDLWAYHCMMEGPLHPAWKDLALRRIHKGSDLAQIIRRYPPMKRQEYEPYTVLSCCEAGETANTLYLVATGGELVAAEATGFWRVGSRWGRWGYVFFSDATHVRLFQEARHRHFDRIRLEEQACRIHRAIAAGQDVFLCRHVERREESQTPGNWSDELIQQYEKAYGSNFRRLLGLGPDEVTVEVSRSLCGDIEPGTVLMFSGRDCNDTDLAEPEPVFLHVDDLVMILPNSKKGGERYLTVPKRALEWYQSLTPEQIEDLDARSLAREAAQTP